MKGFDLVAFGEVALDLLLAGVDKIPRRWSELGHVRSAGIFAAGSAGYVAQCFSKLGGKAAIVGRIGDDKAGRITLEGFRECNVSTRYLVVDKGVETEVSTVVVYNDGNKSSALSRIPPLKLARLNRKCLKGARAFHVGGYLVLSELWGRRLLPWIKSAKREGALVSLDPQMSTKGKWSEPFRHILEHLDLLLLDEVEARKIARKKHTLDAIDSLMDKGVSVVAVKVGRRGCIVGENGRVRLTRAYRTKPVSTIGAGDAFDAAFIYGSLRGWPVEKTAKFSNVVAGLSTTKLGCMTAVPRARDAERIARSHYRSRW